MKKNIIFIVFTFLSVVAFSQTTFRIGGSFPTGKFGDSKYDDGYEFSLFAGEEKYGGAGFGAMLGLQHKFAINNVNGLGVIISADVIWNPLSKDVREYYYDDDDDFTLPHYFNVPLMLGLNYEHSLSSSIAVYGEGALGLNIGFITAYKKEALSFEYESKFDVSTTFAYRLGAGFVFNDKYSIGLSFYSLGTSKVKYEGEYSDIGGENPESGREKGDLGKLTRSVLVLNFGIRF